MVAIVIPPSLSKSHCVLSFFIYSSALGAFRNRFYRIKCMSIKQWKIALEQLWTDDRPTDQQTHRFNNGANIKSRTIHFIFKCIFRYCIKSTTQQVTPMMALRTHETNIENIILMGYKVEQRKSTFANNSNKMYAHKIDFAFNRLPLRSLHSNPTDWHHSIGAQIKCCYAPMFIFLWSTQYRSKKRLILATK